MAAVRPMPTDERPEPEQRVVLRGTTWSHYNELLGALDESSGLRLAYLRGALEIMSPSGPHERIKKGTARLLEAYAEERGVDLRGYGSTTFKDAALERGAEPDECYALGPRPLSAGASEIDRPDLAIEVTMRSPDIDKLAIYAGLGVPEVWFWQGGRFAIHVLREASAGYDATAASALFPELDLALLAALAVEPDQTSAVKRWRAHLRRG